MKKNKMLILLIFVMSLFILPNKIHAEYKALVKYENETPSCEAYSGFVGKCIYQNKDNNTVVGGLEQGDAVTVYENDTTPSNDTNKCSDYYVKVKYSYAVMPWYVIDGYFCHANLVNGTLTDELKQEFSEAGFPESYWESLALLKAAHPNWVFKAANTGLDFDTAVNAELSDISRNLLQVTASVNNAGMLNTANGAYNYYNDTYKVFDGSNWYSANKASVAYYMDPRNFLQDMFIFQFEALAYDESISDDDLKSSIDKVFAGDYLSKFTNEFLAAGKESKVSPVYLASLSRQEVGNNGMTPRAAISGGAFTYGDLTADHVYNFYNIGAYGANAVSRGLAHAYYQGWNTEALAITGGAVFIGTDYVSIGQNTSYFKKWDVVASLNPTSGANYVHQYQQNIQAPSTEAEKVYKSYSSNGVISNSFVFYIPVYDNMPAQTKLSNFGNQNNFLKSISINGNKIAEFDGANLEYNYNLDINNRKIKIVAERVVGSNIVLEYTIDENKTIPITVKAENGAERTYKLNITLTGILNDTPSSNVPTSIQDVLNKAGIKNGELFLSGITVGSQDNFIIDKIKNIDPTAIVTITKTDSNRQILATGDKVKITIGTETKEYKIVIYGDTNGDGKISAVDYAKVKNHVLELITLGDCYLKASDVNKDNKISAVDYAIIKNTVLGSRTIEQ